MATSLVSLIQLVGLIITVAVFLRILFSWINVSPYQNQFAGLVYRITDPILVPFQKLIPPMGGLDLSPMIALIVVNVVQQFLIRLVYSAVGF